MIDNKCGNRLWQKTIDKEMEQIINVFCDHRKNVHAPAGYIQICEHVVFDVKYDLCPKGTYFGWWTFD